MNFAIRPSQDSLPWVRKIPPCTGDAIVGTAVFLGACMISGDMEGRELAKIVRLHLAQNTVFVVVREPISGFAAHALERAYRTLAKGEAGFGVELIHQSSEKWKRIAAEL